MPNQIITQGYTNDVAHLVGANWIISQGYRSGVSTPFLGRLEQILTQMEKYSGIQTVSASVCEPGMDIIKSPFKTVIEKLEKK